ncbi:Exocyst complex component Exo70 [Sesbania bispinosa]|nr:Exocyst complex component Exo70 [Sesbania bispinosa]
MEANIENAESFITRWDLTSSKNINKVKVISLFQHNRKEADDFLKFVRNLHKTMHFLASKDASSEKLVLAQKLMQIAMKRLEHEFYQILSANHDHLDPESVSDLSSRGSGTSNSDTQDEIISEEELIIAGEYVADMESVSAIALSDLKSIADCMISSGHGKECCMIYKLIRKSKIDEGLYNLGVEQLKSSQIRKMKLQTFEQVTKKWLNAVKIAVRNLFSGERILCNHVFSASNAIMESCFSEITREAAVILFRLPELVTKSKRSPEKIFSLMELYEAISDLLPEIESIFCFKSTQAIKVQAHSSLVKLGESIKATLSDFVAAIQKNSSKSPILGGAVHPLTRSTMSFISLLTSHEATLSTILVGNPLPMNSPWPESYLENPNSTDGSTSVVSVHLAWLILVLLCKLDGKAKLYKDVSLAYLFLANNLSFIVENVRMTNLICLLGDHWVARHVKSVKLYASSCESVTWTKVLSALPEKGSKTVVPEFAMACFRKFKTALEDAYRNQMSWIVEDGKLREDLKLSIACKLVPKYQDFYDTYLVKFRGEIENNLESLAWFSPNDLSNYLSHLFHGASTLGST